MLWMILIIVAVVSAVALCCNGCYYDTSVETQKTYTEPNYCYTRSFGEDEYGEHWTKFTFVPLEGDSLNREEIDEVRFYFHAHGYEVSEIMYSENLSRGYLWVYSTDDYVDIPVTIAD